MDRATEKYYEDYLEMFNSDGWKSLIEDMEANLEGVKNTMFESDTDDLLKVGILKGQHTILRNIVNLPATMEFSWKQLRAEEEAEEEAA